MEEEEYWKWGRKQCKSELLNHGARCPRPAYENGLCYYCSKLADRLTTPSHHEMIKANWRRWGWKEYKEKPHKYNIIRDI